MVDKLGFNKQTVDFSGFNGVSKKELHDKLYKNGQYSQARLLASIFEKYDNGDGILSKAEFDMLTKDLERFAKDGDLNKRELSKFTNTLTIGGNKVRENAYSMEDMQSVIAMMTDGKDNVTMDANGNIIQTEDFLGGTKTSTFVQEDNKLRLLSDEVVDDYSKTTTTYKEDGQTPEKITRVSGTMTEDIDPLTGNVLQRVTDKGGGVIDVVEYKYGGEKPEIASPNTPSLEGVHDLPENILSERDIQKPEDNPDNAGKLVKQPNGQYYDYDDQGRVVAIFPSFNGKRVSSALVEFTYGSEGKLNNVVRYSYDDRGRCTGGLKFDGDFVLQEQWVDDEFDENHPEQSGRQRVFDGSGKLKQIIITLGYDAEGRELGYDTFKADGTWSSSRRNEYGLDGTFFTKYYNAKDDGRLTNSTRYS